MSQDRYEKAILFFEKTLELNPRMITAWTNKSSCLARLGRYEEAIGCCDKGLELDPRNIFSWNNKGWSLQENGSLRRGHRNGSLRRGHPVF